MRHKLGKGRIMSGLTEAQRQQFINDGYLVVENVVDPERDIAPVFTEFAAVLDGVAAQFVAEGRIAREYRELPFTDRVTQICAESGVVLSQYFDISLPQNNVRPNTPIHANPAMFRLLTNPRLLDVAQSVIGPEIWSSPVQHIRMKLPPHAVTDKSNGLIAKIPWHQDNGVVTEDADESEILTVWMPLNHATVENGCMQVMGRSHRGEIEPHCPGAGGLHIPDRYLPAQAPIALPMIPGSVLLMTKRTMHSSLDNTTRDQVRISLDLRYQPIGQASGRSAMDRGGFVARSLAHPETVLREPEIWQRNWLELRDALAAAENPVYNRWNADSPVCA